MVFSTLFTGLKALGAGAVGFLVGTFGWSALSGVFAGLLDAVGVHTPASAWLLASPLVGALLALVAAGKVAGGDD